MPVSLEGAVLPNGLKIKKSNFRGLPSYGMMISYEELGFEDKIIPKESRDGIIILPPDTPIGKDIKEVLELKGSAWQEKQQRHWVQNSDSQKLRLKMKREILKITSMQ